jgi:hypothetical protein
MRLIRTDRLANAQRADVQDERALDFRSALHTGTVKSMWRKLDIPIANGHQQREGASRMVYTFPHTQRSSGTGVHR